MLALVVLSVGTVETLARSGRNREPAHENLATALAYILVVAALVPAGISQARALPTIVTPVVYPHYWYATAASIRRTVPRRDLVAVLPWHLYQPLRATEGRLTANPARVFFPGRLITPHNLEIPGRSTEITSRYDRIGLVGSGERNCRLASVVRRLDIHWVLVLDAAEGARTVAGLSRCGYSLLEGRPGFTALMRVAAGRKTP